jgi:hypothetical protein
MHLCPSGTCGFCAGNPDRTEFDVAHSVCILPSSVPTVPPPNRAAVIRPDVRVFAVMNASVPQCARAARFFSG